MPFQKGNKFGGQKGKEKKTIIGELFKDQVQQFDERMVELTDQFLNSNDPEERLAAWQTLVKYRLPITKQVNKDVNITVTIRDFRSKLNEPIEEAEVIETKQLPEVKPEQTNGHG